MIPSLSLLLQQRYNLFQGTEGNPLHLIIVVFALVMFAIAGFGWPAPIEPYRVKFIGIGLFFLTLSLLF